MTDEFILKLQTICKQRPAAAHYDVKSKRLTINDMELFANSVMEVDHRTLSTFLKRLRSIGFVLSESENVTIY